MLYASFVKKRKLRKLVFSSLGNFPFFRLSQFQRFGLEFNSNWFFHFMKRKSFSFEDSVELYKYGIRINSCSNFITRSNCALDRRTILCFLFLDYRVFKNLKLSQKRSKKTKEKKVEQRERHCCEILFQFINYSFWPQKNTIISQLLMLMVVSLFSQLFAHRKKNL